MKSLTDRLKTKKVGGFSVLQSRLNSENKPESNFDIRAVVKTFIKEEMVKLFNPMVKEVSKEIKEEIRPKKGKDYFDGEDGKGIKGENGERGDAGEKGIKGDTGERGTDGKAGRDGLNGLDGKDGKNGKDGKDGSPDTSQRVVEKINEAKGVQISAIENLADELKKIRQRVSRDGIQRGGGGMGNPVHQQFSGNGVTTSFTLTHNVAANGTAVFGCRYQGQTLYLGDQFTISGKTLTMAGFIPDDGTKIEITYIRT